jgi:hypothetical protein
MDIYVMKAAMKRRPYLVNESALPPGYWQEFYKKRGALWQPPKVHVELTSAGLADVLGWIGGVPLFSKRAVSLLVEVSGEALEFVKFGDIKGAPFWVMSKIPTVVDLDVASLDPASPVFCLPDNGLREVLVKPEVPKLVVSRKLRGFEFRRYGKPHLRSIAKGEDVNDFPGVLP